MTESSKWRTRIEIAEHFHISIRSVTNLTRRRVLPYVKIGKIVRFDVSACERALAGFECKSATTVKGARETQ